MVDQPYSQNSTYYSHSLKKPTLNQKSEREREGEYFASINVRKNGTPTAMAEAKLDNGGSKENELRPSWSNHVSLNFQNSLSLSLSEPKETHVTATFVC